MSACNIVRDLMPLYHDSAISASSRKYIREHLLTCPDCRRFYRELRADRRVHPTAPPPFLPSYDAIAMRVREQEKKRAAIRTALAGVNLALSTALLVSLIAKKH